MVDKFVRVTKVTRTGDGAVTADRADDAAAARDNTALTIDRIIWFLTGLLLLLLAFRFVLALLGANPANGFANFIYTASYPFVAPFFGLFGYNLHYGISHFEIFTLVAMAVYAAIAWALTSLVALAGSYRATA